MVIFIKPFAYQRYAFNIVILLCLSALQGCASTEFRPEWNEDTATWKAQILDGMVVRVPKEFPVLKMNSNTWWFVMNSKNSRNFDYGVHQAIRVSFETKPIPNDLRETRESKNIELAGGRILPVENPVKGVEYFYARSLEGKAPKRGSLEGTIITGSAFGYIFASKHGGIVMVSLFKNTHAAVPYEQWHPETEIFTEQERRVVAQIVALVE